MNIRVGTKFKITSWDNVTEIYQVESIFEDEVCVVCLSHSEFKRVKINWNRIISFLNDPPVIFKEFKILSRVKLLSMRRKRGLDDGN